MHGASKSWFLCWACSLDLDDDDDAIEWQPDSTLERFKGSYIGK
jgi:hypothetical protein